MNLRRGTSRVEERPLRAVSRAWAASWRRGQLDGARRREVMSELAVSEVSAWLLSFATLLTLSVVVATMGLTAGSPAVVIGAMLIAPLMNPVLAAAASLSLTLRRQTVVSLLKVLCASLWCIALAFVLAKVVPGTSLTAEIEARTRPDVRDLVVAVAAGAAGTYATVRKDVSAALPGVAVAVALVPPLSTVGIALELGESDLALGALLLYGTNLVAIVFAAVVVFVLTGFVPSRRLANTAFHLFTAVAVTAALLAAIAIPLLGRSADAVEAARDVVRARTIVGDWLNGAALDFDVEVHNGRVDVRLEGFDAPPDDATLEAALKGQMGVEQVFVEWIRTERATTTTTTLPILNDDERLRIAVEPLTEGWLDAERNGSDYELERITVLDGVVRIEIAGSGSKPPIDSLVAALEDSLGFAPQVRIVWTQRETILPGTTQPAFGVIEADLIAAINLWAAAEGVSVESTSVGEETVEVVVAGPAEPPVEAIEVEVRRITGRDTEIQVYFSERRLVTTTSTSSTTSP